jgi:uncharacterized membrane protein YeaQ/YmgE (transglycosylase-associated protein family)
MAFVGVLASLGVNVQLGCIGWAAAGLIGGWLAGTIVRGRGYGCVGDIALGLVGAFLASFFLPLALPSLFADRTAFGFIGTTILAFLGALALAFLGRLIGGNRPKSTR